MLNIWLFASFFIQLMFLFGKTENDVKYMVSLRSHTHKDVFGDNHFCDGSIIAPATVITAAHCVMDKRKCLVPPGRIQVVAGTPNRYKHCSTTMTYRVRRIKIHPAFLENNTNNLALLYIKGRFPDDNEQIKVLPIASSAISNGATCEAIGWGKFLNNGSDRGEPINFTFPMELSTNCHKSQPIYSDDMLCTTDPEQFDEILRSIESGAALICDGSLTGIVSWKIFCGDEIIPRLFTDVFSSEKWIRQNMNHAPKLRQSYLICISYILFYVNCI